jgi:hypothetical protein
MVRRRVVEGEEQEVEGGGQERRPAPAAGKPGEQSRGAGAQGGRREKKEPRT